MDSVNRTDRLAFTLIELMVVIAILVALTSLASLSLASVMDRYQLSRATDTIESFDSRARRSARLSREAFVGVIRRSANEFVVRAPQESPSNQSASFQLPQSVEITDVKLPRRAVTGRDVTINFTDQGRSASYAIELGRGKMTRWIVVLGISGQVIPASGEEEVDALLSM